MMRNIQNARSSETDRLRPSKAAETPKRLDELFDYIRPKTTTEVDKNKVLPLFYAYVANPLKLRDDERKLVEDLILKDRECFDIYWDLRASDAFGAAFLDERDEEEPENEAIRKRLDELVSGLHGRILRSWLVDRKPCEKIGHEFSKDKAQGVAWVSRAVEELNLNLLRESAKSLQAGKTPTKKSKKRNRFPWRDGPPIELSEGLLKPVAQKTAALPFRQQVYQLVLSFTEWEDAYIKVLKETLEETNPYPAHVIELQEASDHGVLPPPGLNAQDEEVKKDAHNHRTESPSE